MNVSKLQFKQIRQAVLAGLLGVGSCFGILAVEARAAEQVILEFGGEERTFPVANIENFARTGEPTDPELRSFVEERPEAGRIIQDLFNVEIFISPAFVSRVQARAASPTGDFILIQLSKLINEPGGSDTLDLLRETVLSSLEDDNRLSLIELIERYPESTIRVNLTGLEPVFNDVVAFVDRVLPALETAREFLQEIICDCEQTGSAQMPGSVATGQSVAGANCVQRSAPVQTPVQTTESDPAPLHQDAAAALTSAHPVP
jgi:Alpha/beta hydrolase of unknown function (DUF1400)